MVYSYSKCSLNICPFGGLLEAAARLKPLPQLGIVITDGRTPWPDRPPRGMKVIVVLFGDVTVPDWATRDDLRAKGVNISKSLSWEKTAPWSRQYDYI